MTGTITNSITQKQLQKREGTTMVSFFETYAMGYWEAGFKVFPVIGKVPPLGMGWHQLIENKQTEEQVWGLSQIIKSRGHGPECGIAIIGSDNVCCIDIDVNDAGLIACAPHSPYICKGAKGVKLLYRHDGSVKSDLGLGGRFPIDLLAKNRYFVIPPSIHSVDPLTNQEVHYQWIGEGGSADQIKSIDDLPLLTLDQIKPLEDYCLKNFIFRNKPTQRAISTMSGIVPGADQIISKFDESRNAGHFGGRNNLIHDSICWKLETMAMEIPEQGRTELNKDELLSVAKWAVELDRKAHPTNPWFTTDEANLKYKGDAMRPAQYMVERIYKKIGPKTIHGYATDKIAEKFTSLAEMGDDFEKTISTTLVTKKFDALIPTEKEWESLVPKEGILFDCYENYMTQANPQVVQFGLATGFAMQSIAASNIIKSYIVNGKQVITTGPQLYSMVVGPTGCGKNSVKSAISRMMNTSPTMRASMKSMIVSGRGFQIGFEKSPKRSVIFNIDEFDSLAGRKDFSMLANTLMAAYSAGGDTSGGVDAGTKEYQQKKISNMMPTIVGLSTAAGLNSFVSSQSNSKGLLNRWLYFICAEKKNVMGRQFQEVKDDANIWSLEKDLNGDVLFDPSMATADINPFMYDLLERPVVIDQGFRCGEGEELKLVAPVKCDEVLLQDVGVMREFGYIIEKYENPAKAFVDLLEAKDIKLITEEDAKNNEPMLDQITNLMARSSEIINKLALHYCISDQKVVQACMEDPTKFGTNRLRELRISHFQAAAKVYELSCRGFIGMLGGALFGGKSGSVEVEAEGGSLMAVVGIMESHYNNETARFVVSRKELLKRVKRRMGVHKIDGGAFFKDALVFMKTQGKQMVFADGKRAIGLE
jgi:hypothetical protein